MLREGYLGGLMMDVWEIFLNNESVTRIGDLQLWFMVISHDLYPEDHLVNSNIFFPTCILQN